MNKKSLYCYNQEEGIYFEIIESRDPDSGIPFFALIDQTAGIHNPERDEIMTESRDGCFVSVNMPLDRYPGRVMGFDSGRLSFDFNVCELGDFQASTKALIDSNGVDIPLSCSIQDQEKTIVWEKRTPWWRRWMLWDFVREMDEASYR